MDTHVKVLGALQIAFGAFGLMAAVLLVFVFGGAAGIVGASGYPDASLAVRPGQPRIVSIRIHKLPATPLQERTGACPRATWAAAR